MLAKSSYASFREKCKLFFAVSNRQHFASFWTRGGIEVRIPVADSVNSVLVYEM